MAFKKVFFENMLNHVIAEDIVVDNSNCLIYLSILANNSDVKEVEGGFFATIKMSNGVSERNMYYYDDGCSYEEVE